MIDPALDLSGFSREDREQLAQALAGAAYRNTQRRILDFYPETGPLRRSLYAKHMEFFAQGANFRERAFRAANRVGKTEGGGGYELTCHLTGVYPDWWVGRRFNHPISAWAAGKTNETTRDILQAKLLGRVTDTGKKKRTDGTGMIPGAWIGSPTWKAGIPDFVDTVPIKWQGPGGGKSYLGLKSYQQKRDAFEGVEQHVIWLDEEPPLDIYGECLIRTMTTQGLIMLTFTPLAGMSEVVLSFMPADQRPDFDELAA